MNNHRGLFFRFIVTNWDYHGLYAIVSLPAAPFLLQPCIYIHNHVNSTAVAALLVVLYIILNCFVIDKFLTRYLRKKNLADNHGIDIDKLKRAKKKYKLKPAENLLCWLFSLLLTAAIGYVVIKYHLYIW